jgi:hypothetical protein
MIVYNMMKPYHNFVTSMEMSRFAVSFTCSRRNNSPVHCRILGSHTSEKEKPLLQNKNSAAAGIASNVALSSAQSSQIQSAESVSLSRK